MFTRRSLLALAGGAGVGLLPDLTPRALAAPRSALGKPIGLKVPGLHGKTADEFAGLLKKAGLAARSYIAGYDAFDKHIDTVVAEAKTLGVKHVVCAWIPCALPGGRGEGSPWTTWPTYPPAAALPRPRRSASSGTRPGRPSRQR